MPIVDSSEDAGLSEKELDIAVENYKVSICESISVQSDMFHF